MAGFTMYAVKFMPQNIELMLPSGTSLTELEFELTGQERIPFGCRAGVCGACVIKVVDGLEHLGSQKQEERDFLNSLGFSERGYRLACQCKLNGEVTIQLL